MSNKLKPCPFCGGKAEIISHPHDWGYTPPASSVKCNDCKVETQKVKIDSYGSKNNLERYVEKSSQANTLLKKEWNRRVAEFKT